MPVAGRAPTPKKINAIRSAACPVLLRPRVEKHGAIEHQDRGRFPFHFESGAVARREKVPKLGRGRSPLSC
ncbi:hypothetical protein NDU88_003986 [Pleurodeles waltl]|uniref:Uncharacterized protein n=1 Tax=Pleurodeles waltl TaxID=8319 RepID=A0AAV7SHH1_PLEWA|nr:hypothetical protein NDU88_003986 [Pleurodeles waltl]